MKRRTRLVLLAAICTLVLAGSVAYLVHDRTRQQDARGAVRSTATTSLAAVTRGPRIVFRNTVLGTHYGTVAEVALAKPSGPRAITDTSCDRVYATQRRIVCLASSSGVLTTYSARVLDNAMTPLQTLPLAGIPSRARLSASSRYVATTTFVAGDSYSGASFSTRTTITRVGGKTLGTLENFTLIHRGHAIHPISRNFWGVTFAGDDDTFYVTAAWLGHTWLARGSQRTRSITTIREDAECPSLSPDGRHIVYKQRGTLPPGRWRLVQFDVGSGVTTPLAETRSVDDQIVWLDNSRVIYGLPRSGSQAAVDDVWEVPSDGTGAPKLLIPNAWSPAVVG